MEKSKISIPEFLQSTDVFVDDSEEDLTLELQSAAEPIYLELENLMLEYGKESVAKLLPLIVQVFENLDSTQRDNRKYLDTIHAISADNEQLNIQYDEERLRRQRRDEDLIQIEEASDLEKRNLRQEIESILQDRRQYDAKIQSLSENLKRAEDRFDILNSEKSNFERVLLGVRQQLHHERNGRKNPKYPIQEFNDSYEIQNSNGHGVPPTFKDFSPQNPRSNNRKSIHRNTHSKQHSNEIQTKFDQELSASFESSQLTRKDMLSSFSQNTKNFFSEIDSTDKPSDPAKIFIFGMGKHDVSNECISTPGKKRRIHSVDDNISNYSMLNPLLNGSDKFEAQNKPNFNLQISTNDKNISSSNTDLSFADNYAGSDLSDSEFFSNPAECDSLLLETKKLQTEKNKILAERNIIESQLNTLDADRNVLQQCVNSLKKQEREHAERNITLESDIKRLKNLLADEKQESKIEPEIFFGFTRTEMAQVLRERDQFKEKYWALKREYGSLEAKRNQKSRIWKFFVNIFKKSMPEEDIRPVSVVLPQISHKNIEEELDEIARDTDRHLFEVDSSPYDCAISSQRATFVPFLRKIPQEGEEGRIDAYGWTLPRINIGRGFEDSIQSITSHESIPDNLAVLSCCRPVSPQEEGAKLWCAAPVCEVMGNISLYNSSTAASLFWVCWGVPNLTKVSVVDSASTEILDTFPVCASPLLTITFVPGFSGPSSPLNLEKPNSKLATMWMGGDSGCLYIHSALVAWDRCLHALRLQSSITDIQYSSGRVYAALTNGTVEIFCRTASGDWDWDNHRSVLLGQRRDFPVLCLLLLDGKLWAGISNTVKIIDEMTDKEEYSIQVHYKVTSQVTHLASYGYGVWLSIRQDSILRLYNSTSFDHLQDIDLAPKVHALLQLPNNNLPVRITTLNVANDYLWVGCGNGVILSIPFCDNNCMTLTKNIDNEVTTVYSLSSLSLTSDEEHLQISPKFTNSTLNSSSPFCSFGKIQLSFHGHTGPVRFIISTGKTVARSELLDGLENNIEDTFASTSLIVSGGEGHVDYRTSEGAIVGGPDMPMRLKNISEPTVVVTDRNYFIVWHAKNRKNKSPVISPACSD